MVGINVPGHIRFFKPTSKTSRYESDPQQLKGVVLYQASEVSCFPNKTVIDPAAKTFAIAHSYLRQRSLDGTLEYRGRLPEDFRQKIIHAVLANIQMRKREKDEFFRWFGKPAGTVV